MEKENNSLQGDKRYHVVSTETAALGRFKIILDMIEERGRIYPYSYIHIGISVGVLPFYKNRVVLVNQYRHSLGKYEYEIPGGGVGREEIPMEAAKRELAEETGYLPDEVFLLGAYYPSPGSSDEITYLYGAYCSKHIIAQREPLEYMSTVLVDEEKMCQMVANGEFKHSMGLVAWMYYMQRKFSG